MHAVLIIPPISCIHFELLIPAKIKKAKEETGMAVSRAAATVAVVLIAALLVAASTERATAAGEDPQLCYCPCMQDQCMTIGTATKEECARACDAGCREGGLPGQPNRFEFCGF